MDDSASTAREACQALVALLAAQDPGAGCSEHSAEAPEVRNVVSDDSGSESHSRGMDSESHSRGMDSESHSRGTDSESHSHDCCDMFSSHFSPADAEAARTAVQRISAGQWAVSNHQDTELGCVLSSFASDTPPATLPSLSSPSDFQKIKLKKRLLKTISKASTLKNSFSSIQKSLAPAIFSYRDILLTSRTHINAADIRIMTVLHSLNHIYKTRDVIIKNNAKLSRADEQTFDFKDQGFTRPKVLIILPTRNSCLQYVQDLILLSDTEQQENRKRFTESFSIESEVISAEKPADFRDLFGGNDDDSFRVGIKFTRKTMKFFSDFYSSDMILASPLGLSLAIHGAHKKKEDYDFLSSIELLVIDHADALIIQNWAHMETILEHINKIPSQSRGCDFSRIKEWYLDGNAKYMRQTIVYSSYLTPELNSLYNLHMLNYEGKIKNKVLYDGSIEDVGLPLVQIFLRFTAPSSQDEADIRFGHFENVILKPFLQSSDHTGTLIFIPSYFDFIRLQNHLESLDASFCSINEYTAPKEISRARSYFQTGQKSIMLYTERSHHFRRLQIRGVKNIAMYGLPDHPNFYPEIVRFLGVSEGKCKILFNKWDAIKLERIVGSRRIRMMCDSSKGDTFEFR